VGSGKVDALPVVEELLGPAALVVFRWILEDEPTRFLFCHNFGPDIRQGTCACVTLFY